MTETAQPDERYSRQRDIVPPDRLAECRATVIGVGAIGRQVALQLAAMGIPWLQLVDFDAVEASNLASQGYLEDDLGRPKVEAAGAMCLRINRSLDLQAVNDRFRRSMEIGTAVFCAVDKIEIRRAIWEAVKDKASFFVDGRRAVVPGGQQQVLLGNVIADHTDFARQFRQQPHLPAAPQRSGGVVHGTTDPNDRVQEPKRFAVLEGPVSAAHHAQYAAIAVVQPIHTAHGEPAIDPDAAFRTRIERLELDIPVQPTGPDSLLGGGRVLEPDALAMPRHFVHVHDGVYVCGHVWAPFRFVRMTREPYPPPTQHVPSGTHPCPTHYAGPLRPPIPGSRPSTRLPPWQFVAAPFPQTPPGPPGQAVPIPAYLCLHHGWPTSRMTADQPLPSTRHSRCAPSRTSRLLHDRTPDLRPSRQVHSACEEQQPQGQIPHHSTASSFSFTLAATADSPAAPPRSRTKTATLKLST